MEAIRNKTIYIQERENEIREMEVKRADRREEGGCNGGIRKEG